MDSAILIGDLNVRPAAIARRARLIGVATTVIAEEGVGSCTFRRLAEAAGTSTRPFTHMFGFREVMLAAVASESWVERAAWLSVAADVPGGDGSILAELVARGEQRLPLSPELARLERAHIELTLFSISRPALREEFLRIHRESGAHLAARIAEGQQVGQITTELSAVELGQAYIALFDGLGLLRLSLPEENSPDVLIAKWRRSVRQLMEP